MLPARAHALSPVARLLVRALGWACACVASWGRCAEGLSARCVAGSRGKRSCCAHSARTRPSSRGTTCAGEVPPRSVGAAAQCVPAGAAVLGPADRSRKSGCRVRHRAGRVPHNGCQARRAEGRRRRPTPPRLWFVCLFVCLFVWLLAFCSRRRADGAHLLRHAHRPNRLQHGCRSRSRAVNATRMPARPAEAPHAPSPCCALVARTHGRAARLEESPHLPSGPSGWRTDAADRPTGPAGLTHARVVRRASAMRVRTSRE